MDQAGRQARTLRRHEESEAEIDRVRKEESKQLTFRPDIHAQQAALRGNNNSTVAKSQKMLRRRQKAAAAAMPQNSERNNSETVQFATPGGPGQKRSPERDPFLSRAAYTQKLVSPSSNGIPKQEPAPEATTTAQSPLLTEKKAWVDRLKRENAQLVEMLSVARSAKQQVMKAAERLDIEQSKSAANKLAAAEQDLEHLIAALPIATKFPSDDAENAEDSLAGSAANESTGLAAVPPSAANDSAASAQLHSTLTRLLFRLRSNQMTIFERSLEAARYAEDAFLDGHTKSATTAVQQLRDVVQYLDLGDFFDEKWGEGSIDVLRRRYIAMHTGMSGAGAEAAKEDEASVTEADMAAKDEEIAQLKEQMAELEKSNSKLTKMNTALRNNVNSLRAKKRDATPGNGTDTPGRKVTQAGSFSTPQQQGVESPVRGDVSEQPSWNGLSGEWAKLCWTRLVEKTTTMVKEEPLADRLPPQVISEIAEYVATELSSHFSQMLKPVIDAEFGVNSAGGPLSAHDTPRAAGICNQLLEHPAVTSEITPHIKMALTYVTSRSSSP